MLSMSMCSLTFLALTLTRYRNECTVRRRHQHVGLYRLFQLSRVRQSCDNNSETFSNDHAPCLASASRLASYRYPFSNRPFQCPPPLSVHEAVVVQFSSHFRCRSAPGFHRLSPFKLWFVKKIATQLPQQLKLKNCIITTSTIGPTSLFFHPSLFPQGLVSCEGCVLLLSFQAWASLWGR